MKRFWRRAVLVLAGLSALSVAAGMAFSKAMWGYWISPPSVSPWVEQFEAIDAIARIECKPGNPATSDAVSEADLHKYGAAYLQWSPDHPGDQVWAAVHLTGKRIGRGELAPATAQAMCDELWRSGWLVDGEPGYGLARWLHGNLAAGRTRTGRQLYVVSLVGGPVSNDHYPVYDAEFLQDPPHLQLGRHHQYFEDAAGIEGARWFPVAAVLFISGSLVLGAAAIVAYGSLLAARRLSAARTRRRASRS